MATITDQADKRPLLCNCAIRLVNVWTSEVKTVRTRQWSCPSCGRDKANKVRDMVIAAETQRMWTLTFDQPIYEPDQPPPTRHTDCLPGTHLYEHTDKNGRTSLRWRMLEECSNCCRESGRAIANFRKSLRRRWPDAQLLWVREVKPRSGAFDINVAIVGVPMMTRKTRAGRLVKELWLRSGGGFMDLGEPRSKNHSPGALGRYIGKYLTKHAERYLARGFRRWSRTHGFAPGLRMAEPREPKEGPVDVYGFLGWVNPLTLELMPMNLRFTSPP